MTLADEKERVINRLLGNKIIKEYHVFADDCDGFFDNYDEALATYKELCKNYDNVRLYEQFWEDKAGEIIEENCLKAKGVFPT